MALKLIYLLTTRIFAWAQLTSRDETAKNIEILILRHQLTVAQHRDPHLAKKLNWTDRAWLTLLAVKALILRLAKENPTWGYRRIHRELAGLGIRLAPSTIWEILKNTGIDPAPLHDTGPTWTTFLRSQAEAILACDFVVIDLLDGSKAYVLAVIEHTTRRVRILGSTLHPTTDWVVQQARNLLMDLDEAAATMKYLIHDRDTSFSAAFDAVFTAAGIEVIRTGIHAPRQNSIMERWFRSPRAELTDRTLIWNTPHLMRLLREYEGFYNRHRPHQAMDQTAPLKPRPDNVIDLDTFRVRRHDRAGGLLHEYHQVA